MLAHENGYSAGCGMSRKLHASPQPLAFAGVFPHRVSIFSHWRANEPLTLTGQDVIVFIEDGFWA